ncbi:MAG: murein biosynthesis integral membrane protein MurJ [Spirochaetaceae bacterium]|jgi:putative peptidoglycan lipid II flippase|nr:murein biosynthesis integral membrane protein MurJ [Spirochaetaceae bacterium]
MGGSASERLIKHGSLLSIFTLCSRVLGLLRETTKAALLGTSALSDAFSVAFLIPNLFRRLFAEGSISTAFIPVFKSCLIDGDEKKTKEFLNCAFTFLSFTVSLAVGAGILAAPLLAPLFGMESFNETVFLTRLMFPFLGFISIAAFFQGILNSVNVFSPPALAPILLNISTIACAWLLKDALGNAAAAMAAGVVLGGFLGAAFQAPFVIKNGFKPRLTGLLRSMRNEQTKAVLKLIAPTIVGMAAYQLNDLVSSVIARKTGSGVLSSLQYSLRLQELFLGVFAVSIGTVLLPSLSGAAKMRDFKTYNERLSSALNIISLITIPVTFYSLLFGKQIISLLFQMKNFDQTSLSLTLEAFKFHIAGLFFIAVNRILSPAFYAVGDARSPTIAGVISLGLNAAGAAILAGPLKGGGIALALSLAAAVNTAALFFMLSRKGTGSSKIAPQAFLYLLKTTVISIASCAPLVFASGAVEAFCLKLGAGTKATAFAALCSTSLLFGLLLLAVLNLTGDKYIKELLRLFLRKKRRRE